MDEQQHCPRCGNPLVNYCPHCDTRAPAATNERLTVWPPNISEWSIKQLALFWIIAFAAIDFIFCSDSKYIGAAMPVYITAIVGIPYALFTVTLKWLRLSRR
jgi:hypothetical protein